MPPTARADRSPSNLDPITPGATYTDSSGAVNAYETPPSTVPVPNVVGESETAASAAIVSAGLTVGATTQQSSMTIVPGQVISQSPASGGANVADGSAVNLVVSSGSTCADLSLVKAAFGSKLGQPTYNAAADVNHDGVVNIIDLSMVARALPTGTVCN
jgi:hypothetical protein